MPYSLTFSLMISLALFLLIDLIYSLGSTSNSTKVAGSYPRNPGPLRNRPAAASIYSSSDQR